MVRTDPKKVMKLREETGLGVMACKKVLAKTKGNFKKAKERLEEEVKGKSKEKQNREIKAGIIDSYIHRNRIGVLLKLGCETDFVAKNKDFKNLAHNLCLQIASMDPENIKELLGQPHIKDEEKSIKEIIDQAIGKIGERIEVIEFVRYEI